MKKKRKADAIISGDWHLMEEERTPPCRLDSIWEAQWNKVHQIEKLQEKHECPVVLSGDMFDHWKASPNLINACFAYFPKQIQTIIGNHDLAQHSIGLLHKTGIEILFRSKLIDPIINGGHWGVELDPLYPLRLRDYTTGKMANKKAIILHTMTWKDKLPYPGCEDPQCNKLFTLFPEADLIITGHNHKTFTAKKGKQLLINPGSLTRHDADQMDHKPCVFLWYAEDNSFDIHYLKINENAMSREHIEDRKRKEKQVNDFMEKLQGSWKVSLSFEENIERALEKNKVPQGIKEIILKWIDK